LTGGVNWKKKGSPQKKGNRIIGSSVSILTCCLIVLWGKWCKRGQKKRKKGKIKRKRKKKEKQGGSPSDREGNSGEGCVLSEGGGRRIFNWNYLNI